MALLEGLANSKQFDERYRLQDLEDTEVVTLFYRLLFDREPDGMGLGDFTAKLKQGELSRKELLMALIGSAEFKAHHPILF